MVGIHKGQQVQICSYYAPQTAARLRRLAEKTRITLAVYLREAAEDLLAKYEEALREQPGEEAEGMQGRV